MRFLHRSLERVKDEMKLSCAENGPFSKKDGFAETEKTSEKNNSRYRLWYKRDDYTITIINHQKTRKNHQKPRKMAKIRSKNDEKRHL